MARDHRALVLAEEIPVPEWRAARAIHHSYIDIRDRRGARRVPHRHGRWELHGALSHVGHRHPQEVHPAEAISRVARTGSFSTLHNALRFRSRGRTRSVSQKYTLAVLTPICSATSTTDRPRLIRASRRWRLKLGLRGNDMLLLCCGREHRSSAAQKQDGGDKSLRRRFSHAP